METKEGKLGRLDFQASRFRFVRIHSQHGGKLSGGGGLQPKKEEYLSGKQIYISRYLFGAVAHRHMLEVLLGPPTGPW